MPNRGARLTVQLMDGYEHVLEALQLVQAAGARGVCVDPPPGDGVKLIGMGIEQAMMEVRQIVQGREDTCRACGLRIVECRCAKD